MLLAASGISTPSKQKPPKPKYVYPPLKNTVILPPKISPTNTLTSGGLPSLSLRTFILLGLPIGLFASLDIALSNLSLVSITISMYTIIKSSSPLFVLSFAFLFRLEKPSLHLLAVIFFISIGELITVHKPSSVSPSITFNSTNTSIADIGYCGDTSSADEQTTSHTGNEPLGILWCLLASMFSGLRWTLVQLILKNLPDEYQSPFVTIRLTSPFMWITIVVMSFLVEPWSHIFNESVYFESFERCFQTFCIAAGGGLLAVLMILSEFSLILNSSAVVLTIGGVVKELCTILLGVIVFNDIVTELNLIGFAVVLLGVGLFKFRPKDSEEDIFNDEDDDDLAEEGMELVGIGGEANEGFQDYEESDEDEEALQREIWGGTNPFNS
ncbi:hypothetical protein TL16_g10820 [Triparma laevis f. inornata]|uniref:Sugar phosphate transporter domain-containing protein n=1 Tax=Triparma laevis f. inornata TaxID=1714386 RepID=A0A9W7ERP3_9STRA|nr:hypothetical protein TL16_g10820 [Triparma laevis f. inornata]